MPRFETTPECILTTTGISNHCPTQQHPNQPTFFVTIWRVGTTCPTPKLFHSHFRSQDGLRQERAPRRRCPWSYSRIRVRVLLLTLVLHFSSPMTTSPTTPETRCTCPPPIFENIFLLNIAANSCHGMVMIFCSSFWNSYNSSSSGVPFPSAFVFTSHTHFENMYTTLQ